MAVAAGRNSRLIHGAAARDLAGPVVHVLVGERHARERSGCLAATPVLVDLPRAGDRVLGIEADEGVEVGVQPVDARERRFHQIGGGELAARNGIRRLAKAECRDLVLSPRPRLCCRQLR